MHSFDKMNKLSYVTSIITRKWKWYMYTGGLLLTIIVYLQFDTMETVYHSYSMRRWRWKLFNCTAVPDHQQIEHIAQLHPNLPIHYWHKYKDVGYTMFYKNQSCALFPSLFHLNYNNFYWQILHTRNLSFQFFSAYYDNRRFNPEPNIRLLSMIDDVGVNKTIFGHLWFDNQTEPVIVETKEYHHIWYREWGMHVKGVFGPYLITFRLPKSHQNLIPAAISIVEKPCDLAQNILKVVYNKPISKKKFTVCVKGLDFLEVDLSVRLVEWLEFMFLQGADKVFMYQLQVHPNMKKVLDYYQSQGKVDVRKVTLPEGQPNIPFLQHIFIINNNDKQVLDELIPYNDCFYRNIYAYKYVTVIDIDEIIMPLKDKDWNRLMKRVISEEKLIGRRFASYNARNIYFLDDLNPNGLFSDIPPYMHMLQHVYRSQNFTPPGAYIKSFLDTDRVITVHNHYPIHCSDGVDLGMEINIKYAQMNHYRKTCPFEVDCKPFRTNPVKDTTIWKYKKKLIRRINAVLKTIGFLN